MNNTFSPLCGYAWTWILGCMLWNPTQMNAQNLLINEFLASNGSVIADPDFNEYSDWIELYNPGGDTLDLGDCYLTDDLDEPDRWTIPAGVRLAPGEFLLVWADGRDTSMQHLHAGFILSSEGEEIGVSDPAGSPLDSIVFGGQIQDVSFGRHPDGSSTWYFHQQPTPGMPNTGLAFLKAGDPEFSLPGGFYTTGQTLAISSPDPLAEIRYTTNGDEPDSISPLYTGPIQVDSRNGDPNQFSMIRTNRDPFVWLPDWEPPAGEVFKATVIRARAFREGYAPSGIISASYFVDPEIQSRYPTIPVISILSDQEHLFDNQSGIYVPGIYHQLGNSWTGNYFMDWEKPAHIEFFEPGGEPAFAQDVGISIQGGSSPASPQKGLHVIARSKYGPNRIEYPIFHTDPSGAKDLTEFKRFIIRAWGSLITGSLFNDAYAHRLMAGQDLDIQAYRPVVVFINGEYWGLHALREANKNSWYYQYHHGVDREDPGCDILLHGINNGQPYAFVDEGDAAHWNSMMGYIRSHDMNLEEPYHFLESKMDMDNFITYMGHCIYVGKWDWPNNNDASWRPRTAEGRWRWIQFDMETGFGVGAGLGPEYEMLDAELNMFEAAIKGLNIPDFGQYGPHPILAKIYRNEEFKEAFLDWFVERFSHEFHPDTMNHLLDEMSAEIRPYMAEYQQRWPFIGNTRGSWESSLEGIRAFNNERLDHVKKQLLDLYTTDKIPPVDYRLLQNYHNPFVTSTRISYMLPRAGKAAITVYNSLGQPVAQYERQHDAEGHFHIDFNARDCGAGVYYYSLECNGFYAVKKMLLLR